MEQFENLYGNIMLMIENENQIPEEVMRIVIDLFRQVKEIYIQNRCNNDSISEKIEIEANLTIGRLKESISDDLRNEQFLRASEVLNRIKENLKEIEQKSSQISKDELQGIENDIKNKAIEGISEIGEEKTEVFSKIMRVVEVAIDNIISRQKEILYDRGELSIDAIYAIQQQVSGIIEQFQDEKREEILKAFQKKDGKLKEAIVYQVEEYMQYRAQLRKQKSEIPEEKAEVIYRESLKVGITLDKQAESAKKFLREQEEKEEQNPNGEKLLVDELPELLL